MQQLQAMFYIDFAEPDELRFASLLLSLLAPELREPPDKRRRIKSPKSNVLFLRLT
jgi:hypothetical protein